jgi:chromosome segregation ATPase
MAHRYTEIEELKDQIAQRYAEIAELREQMAQRNAEIAELRDQATRRDAETAELKDQILQMKNANEERLSEMEIALSKLLPDRSAKDQVDSTD